MTRPLNILIVNSGRKWIGEVGHCVALQRELIRRGHRVWMGCRLDHELHAYLLRESLPHVAFDFRGGFAPFRDTRDALRMARFIRENKIDLVHTHRGKDHWSAIFATLLAPAPTLRTRHVVTRVRPHFFNRWLYTRATPAIISVSKAAEASFNRLIPAMRNRRVILSAVDRERFNPARRSGEWRREAAGLADDSGVIWIGLIGRFQNIKGQEVFLKAAGRVAREFPGARFLLAGRGESTREKRYRKIAASLGFNDRLKVEGVIEDLPKVMASLDVGVVASLGSEGFSRVSCEYMASGVPVVATWVGGIPDILAPDGFSFPKSDEPSLFVAPHGIMVPPGDPEALADAIIQTLREPAPARERMAAGLEAVKLRHDPGAWAAKIEQVYLEVLEKKS